MESRCPGVMLSCMSTGATEHPSSEREMALDRLKKRRDLRNHAFAYVVINGAFWALWALTE